MIYQETAGGKV